MHDKRLILLTPDDNVLVACQPLEPGEILIDGNTRHLTQIVDVGHKVARFNIAAGARVIRYGVSIGSALEAIAAASHVHLHNMKSNYIAPHSRGEVEE